MGEVQTVLGLMPAAKLGKTLLHEHIVFDGYDRAAGPPGYGWREVVEAASAELAQAAAEGLGTLVDVTPIGNERSPLALAEISHNTGVQVVCATGFWVDPPLLRLVGTEDIEALADLMVKEIQEGIEGTNVRAGIIKVATSAEMTPREERVLRVAARASRRTGVAITTHTHRGALALEQVDLLEREGVAPERMIIGHIGGTPKLELHLALARRGVYLGYDRTGQGHEQDDEAVFQLFVEMVKRGYQRQITLSQDTSIFLFGRRRLPLPPEQGGHSLHERPAYSHLWHSFVPRARALGVRDEDFDTMFVENPARVLPLAR